MNVYKAMGTVVPLMVKIMKDIGFKNIQKITTGYNYINFVTNPDEKGEQKVYIFGLIKMEKII